jgi:hypothetical protein
MALLAVAMLAGCGSSGSASADELAQARQEGAAAEREKQAISSQRQKQARLEARIKRLEKQLAKAQKTQQKKTTAAANPATRSSGSSRASCGDNLSVGSNTTCPFAQSVYSAWYSAGGGTVTVEAYSPVTHRYYTMYCTAGVPTVCRGGNNAVVYIR